MNRMRQYKKGSFVKKYQPGGMLMYGDPKLGDQTFSNIVYQESEAGKQEALEEQMKEAQADNTAMEEANAALQRNYAIGNRIEATGQSALQAGKKGLLKLASDPLKGQTPNWSAAMIPNAAGETASLASGTVAGAATDAATGLATDAATDVASKGAGKLATFASKYVNPQHAKAVNPYAIAGQIAGAGISYLSDDDDATTLNFGEGAGGVISGAASGASLGSLLGPVGTVVGGTIGGLYGLGKGLYQRNKARNTIGAAEDEKTAELNRIGARMRREGVRSREYSGYDFGRTLAKTGGVRLPGGTMEPIPGSDAVEFKGKSHKQGGILLDEQTEVEGGETMDKVTMKNEGPSDYFFSKYLKLGGQSFAQRHKQLLKKGGTQQDIDALAQVQEKVAGRNPGVIQMERGGVKMYQQGGLPLLPYPDNTGNLPVMYDRQGNLIGGSMRDYDPSIYSQSQNAPFAPVDNTYVYLNTKLPPMGPEPEEPLGVNTPVIRTPVRGGNDQSDALPMLPYPDDVGDLPVMYDEDGNPVASTSSTAPTPAVTPGARQQQTPVTLPPKPLPKVDNTTPVKPEIVQQIQELEAKKETQGLTDDERKALNKLYRDVPMGAYAAGAAQMLPAAYAFLRKEKAQKLMGPAGRIGSPKLDRVDYNKERSQNASDARAISKSIETSGSGPAGIIAKMAAFKRKQDGDMQIAAQESRVNAGIQSQEAQMAQRANIANVQNAMAVDQINTQMMEAQRIADENRRYMAIDKLANASAGLMGDVMSYKANERMARAIGSMGIYEREKLFNSMLGKINPRTGKPYNRNDIAELYNISLEDNNLLQEAQTPKDMENMSVYERAMAMAGLRGAKTKS